MEPVKPGIFTTEFFTTVGAVAVQGVIMFVMAGIIKESDQESVTKSVSGLIGSLGAFAGNAWAIYTYIRSRTEIKKQAMTVRYVLKKVVPAPPVPAKV
jgi:hypothetical protein